MSPRNDSFLSFCLAQAELSPLHYRHGSIIVRGGKVIGQGFNTYRPGFDGGALKTGTLPASALDGPAIKELKERLKLKSKSKPDAGNQETQQNSGSFTPFEIMGHGHNANTPLSMHSEMMAIRSALSLSSGTLSSQTSARAAAYYQKPCFKLPGDSKKRKARARGLKAYAEAVCDEAAPANTTTGKASRFNVYNRNEFYHVEEENGSLNEKKSTLKHRKEKKKYGSQYGNQYDVPYHGTSNNHYQHKRDSEPLPLSMSTVTCIRSPDIGPTCSTEDLLRSQKITPKPPKKTPPIHANPQQILITKNKSVTSKHDIASRTKDLRLKGSDLYVARLGSCNATPPLPLKSKYKPSDPGPALPIPSPKSEPTSLYDELSPLSRTASLPATSTVSTPPSCQPEIRASRPCYRCVSAMHAVGIKRVFWTNADGEWEGAKVRDLVEALEMGDGEPAHDDGGAKGVFITKHEVLMLKRMIGS